MSLPDGWRLTSRAILHLRRMLLGHLMLKPHSSIYGFLMLKRSPIAMKIQELTAQRTLLLRNSHFLSRPTSCAKKI